MALVFPPEPHGLHPHPYSADREASCPSSEEAAHEDASRPGEGAGGAVRQRGRRGT